MRAVSAISDGVWRKTIGSSGTGDPPIQVDRPRHSAPFRPPGRGHRSVKLIYETSKK
jgi:hypothetical protein